MDPINGMEWMRRLQSAVNCGEMTNEEMVMIVANAMANKTDITMEVRAILWLKGYEDFAHEMCIWELLPIPPTPGYPNGSYGLLAGSASGHPPEVHDDEGLEAAITVAVVAALRARNVNAHVSEKGDYEVNGRIYHPYHNHSGDGPHNKRVDGKDEEDWDGLVASFSQELEKELGPSLDVPESPPEEEGWGRWGL